METQKWPSTNCCHKAGGKQLSKISLHVAKSGYLVIGTNGPKHNKQPQIIKVHKREGTEVSTHFWPYSVFMVAVFCISKHDTGVVLGVGHISAEEFHTRYLIHCPVAEVAFAHMSHDPSRWMQPHTLICPFYKTLRKKLFYCMCRKGKMPWKYYCT